MEDLEPSFSFPEEVESATIRISDMPEAIRADYQNYLDSRVFEMLYAVRPWGINGETMKYLLMDSLAEEEMAKGLPCPAIDDVDTILNEQWVIENVQSRHRSYELGVLKVQEAEKKVPKECTTPANGMVKEVRTFIDFGADLEVLQEVAAMKKEMEAKGEQVINRTIDSFNNYMNKYPTLKGAEAVITVADAREQLKRITMVKLNEEQPVPAKRWTWFEAEDLESLRRMPQSVKVLQEKLFTDELKDDELDRSRKLSVSESVSSMTSRKDTVGSRASQQTEDEVAGRGMKRKGFGGRPPKRGSAVSLPPVRSTVGNRGGRPSKASMNL